MVVVQRVIGEVPLPIRAESTCTITRFATVIGNRPASPRTPVEVDGIDIVTAGKQANLVVIDRNLAENIATTRKVKLVFKDIAGYDPAKLLDSVKGTAGLH
jgi:hypothetical protein